MDPLADLRGKINVLPQTTTKAGLQAVLRHLEVAEDHFERAKRENNDSYFNDAVYRANQSYEGSLKEAWRVLKGQDPAKKKTHQLETGLTQTGVLTSRAKSLLQNYREQWRNPSTHDHTLLFGHQDAFLALWSAIAFATVLLDQIVSRLSEEEATAALDDVVPGELETATPIDEPIPLLLWQFARTPTAFYRANGQIRSEAEIIGWLNAFVRRHEPNVELEAQPKLKSGLIPDLLLSRGDERVVVELKRGSGDTASLGASAAQVLSYLNELDLTEGVIVLAPSGPQEEMASWIEIFQAGERLLKVWIIAPQRLAPPGHEGRTDAEV